MVGRPLGKTLGALPGVLPTRKPPPTQLAETSFLRSRLCRHRGARTTDHGALRSPRGSVAAAGSGEELHLLCFYYVPWPRDHQPWAEFSVQRGPLKVAVGFGPGGGSLHLIAVRT